MAELDDAVNAADIVLRRLRFTLSIVPESPEAHGQRTAPQDEEKVRPVADPGKQMLLDSSQIDFKALAIALRKAKKRHPAAR